MTTPAGADVWRLYNVDGVPASGPHRPVKADVIAWAASLEGEVSDAMADAAAAVLAAAAVAPIPNGLILAAMPKTATVTLTLGSPGTINWTGHGLPAYTPLFLTTTGALLTGLTAGSIVYVTAGASLQTNSFRVSSSIANAIAGTSINFTGTQSGTHTAWANYSIPYPYKGHRLTSIISIADNVGLVDSVDKVWNVIVLPAGNWRCLCQSGVIHNTGTTPVISHMHSDFGIGTTSIQTSPAGGATTAMHLTSNDPNGWIFPNMERVFNLPSGGNLNAVMQTNFTGGAGALLCYGTLVAELF
ncbi:hypothetical protein [Azospirillum sp.]|uniref:hypothetical protein n=1 Tax=Azospirillum sp. TaxID=34012 RepID=UPI002D55ECEE|nr:hypothetical protein [Azospirillum sp.]HYD66161.1 hypothetical protein [Azospirillum sp.]